jgi:PadR family transcriptional regulator, regulatory protein PadR
MRTSSTKKFPRIGLATVQILDSLLSDAPGDTDWYMLNVCRRTGLGSGTVSRILTRLVDVGWLAWYWEDRMAASCQGHPRRKFYRLTDIGVREAKEVIRSKVPAMWVWRSESR